MKLQWLLVPLCMASCSDRDQTAKAKESFPTYGDLAVFLADDFHMVEKKFGEASPVATILLPDSRLLEGTDGFLVPVNIYGYGKWDVLVNHYNIVIGVVLRENNHWGYPAFGSRVVDEMVKRLPEPSVEESE